jgi:tetratricopeptide (TPR) repeat protein
VALDPRNVDALVGMASVDVLILGNFYPDDRIVRLNSAEATLVSALYLAPDHALGHTYSGMLKMYTNRASEGIADCERALALDRNLAVAHGYIGMGKYFIGRAGETEAHIREALRLSPRDTFVEIWLTIAGISKIFAGLDEEAIGLLRQALEANRSFSLTHIYLAVALAGVGRLDEARRASKVGMSMDPAFTIQRYRAGAPSDNPVFVRGRERVYEGMQRAGIPEA